MNQRVAQVKRLLSQSTLKTNKTMLIIVED